MRSTPFAVTVVLASTLVLAAGVARMTPGTYPEKAEAWKKFTVREVTLGTEFSKVPGFTCGPDPVSKGFTSYRHTCVKFLDERCKGRPSKIFHIRSSADLPRGQACFMDEGSAGTYLDGKLMSPPLSYLSIVATDTSAPRVYEVNYTFANDVLTDQSNLGKALIAKYGPPQERNEPLTMFWQSGDVTLRADCGATQGPAGEFCSIKVSDDAFHDSERAIQQAFDDEQKLKNGPPAPKL